MRQLRLVAAFILLGPCTSFAQGLVEAADPSSAPSAQLASENRLRDFLDALVVSTFYLQVAGAGVIDEVTGFPQEWSGYGGFGQRTVARLGQAFAAEGIGHGTAALLKHRVAYDACTCTGGLGRTGHALARAFVSVTDRGGRAPNISLWTAKYGSAALADPWYPESYRQRDWAIHGSVAIVIAAGLNVVKEFAPELRRLAPF